MRGGRKWSTVLLAGAAGLAALGPLLLATATPAAAFTTGVNIEDKPRPDPNGDGLFNPGTTTINVGSKVLWTNKTSNRHTVTSDPGAVEFDSGDLRGPGGQFEFRFDTVGTFTYRCTRHPKMVGRVQVVDPNAPTTTTTTAPVTTTTAAPVTTTTAPATTTTAAPTTTTTEPRPASGVVPPPTAAASPPPPSTTTSVPSTTTTTTAPPTTPTSAAPALAGGDEGTLPPPSSAPPSTATTQASTDKTSQAAGPPVSSDGKLDVGAVVLVAALVAVGAFGAWTLIRVRPGRI